MPSMMPDLMTAFGMTALAAFVAAWLLWLRGRLHRDKGVRQAILAALLFGVAYLVLAVQARLPDPLLQVASRVLVSAGIAAYTLALLRFRQRSGRVREVLVFVVPVLGNLLLAAWWGSPQGADVNVLQVLLTLLQAAYMLVQLIGMRSSTPGTGWLVVTVAICVQTAALVPTVFPGPGLAPPWAGIASLRLVLATWGSCVLLFLNVIVVSVGFLIMLRDRAAVLERHRADLDPLTELGNRTAMARGLQAVIDAASRAGRPMALLMVDIDHFKQLNDRHGHLVGDQAIQVVAQVLAEHARSSDQVARYGGEEFVVVLPDTPPELAGSIAQRLCAVIRDTPLRLPDGDLLTLTASIGVHACVPVTGTRWQVLLDAADAAMYEAKRCGRDRVALSAT